MASKHQNKLLIDDAAGTRIKRGSFREIYLERCSEEIFHIEHKINGTPMVFEYKNQACDK